MERILRVNTRTREAFFTNTTEEELRLGGRYYIDHILMNEVPPTCEPLGRYNKLILTIGLMSDTLLSTAGQLNVGGKSPLTGGVKESNAGGTIGKRLAKMGLKAIILEDTPCTSVTRILVVSVDGARFVDAPELRHALVSDTVKYCRNHFNPKAGLVCIGPAGEMKMCSAGVASVLDDGIQVRYAGRGGMGALMGSKGVKAIVVDDKGSKYAPKAADPELLNNTIKAIANDITSDPKSKNRKLYGTIDIIDMANEVGLMPTNSFSAGSFNSNPHWCGENFSNTIKERGGMGRSGTPCVPGCTIQCSNVYPDAKGNRITASLQYESVVQLGSNCGIGDMDKIAELNDLCNEVGVDTIDCGVAIGICMDVGLLEFGDFEASKDAIMQIAKGTPLGRIIGAGAAIAGRVLGSRRVAAVKGQAMPAYDPRALKGNGVTYITSPQGADHTAGNCFETLKTNNPLGLENQAYNSRRAQVRAGILDTFGVCLFLRPSFVKNPQYMADLINGRYGWGVTIEDVKEMSADMLAMEREFNRKAGVPDELANIPEFMTGEKLTPTGAVYDIPKEEMMKVWSIELEKGVF